MATIHSSRSIEQSSLRFGSMVGANTAGLDRANLINKIFSCSRGGTFEWEAFVSARKTPPKLNRMLIVSGDDDLNLLLGFLIEADGFQVAVSTTPELAIQTLLRDQPQAIFFDFNFQGGNSLSLFHFVQEACPNISIFTVVRPELRALAEQSLHTGAQGFLLTPVDYRGVKKLLGGSSAGRTPTGTRSMYRRSGSPAVAGN